ncbi:MAG TPA: DUF1592 domain-containing protein [Polyangia bacterium]|nr:DUF1592 domain-containing protein [Polyangia bacterium]
MLTGCVGSVGPARQGNGSAGAGTGGTGIGPTGTGATGGTTVLGPAAGRRLNKDEYINTVRDLLGVDLSAPADSSVLIGDEPATGGGFRNDIAALFPSSLRTNVYETVAISVSERVAWAGRLGVFATCTDATATCREGFIRRLGRLLYRRPLTDADVLNLAPLFDLAGVDAAGFQAGGRLVLQAMLQSPHFLYRLERLDSTDATSGQPAPTPFELATRLSYLLWQSAPSPELLDAAERGDLSAGAAFQTTVVGMLADARARLGFEGYAQDWLQLYRLDTRTSNPQKGVTDALIGEMKQETLRFVDRVALTEKLALAALLTDKKTELGPALAAVYGLTPSSQGFASYDLAQDPNRIGILTQPGFLILRTAPDQATIVHRGLMILRDFLCAEVPAPPADAASKISMVPANLTDRDRFALHTADATCKGCHDAFDPLGYPFEPFDLAGRFRTKDDFGNTLRSDGQVSLDSSVQTFKNTAEFAALLSRSPTVQRCFVQKLYQYAAGRALEGDEARVIDGLATQFSNAGGTYFAAATSVAGSPSFRAMAPVK